MVNGYLFNYGGGRMKYLGLHKIIWFVVVVVFTFLEMVVLAVIYAIYLLWNLRLPHNLWSYVHTSNEEDELCGVIYKDENPIETIKRRYEFENVSL